jgi:hypothetical protein
MLALAKVLLRGGNMGGILFTSRLERIPGPDHGAHQPIQVSRYRSNAKNYPELPCGLEGFPLNLPEMLQNSVRFGLPLP